MQLSKVAITTLMEKSGITQNDLARRIGVWPGTLSNALSGRRGVGRTVLAGLLKTFPEQSVQSLTVVKRQVKI